MTPSRALTTATWVTVCVILPVLLASAMVVQLARSLGQNLSGLGMSVAVYFLAASLVSSSAGRVVQRMGWGRSLQVACLASGATLLGVALAQAWWQVAVLFVLGGLANAVGQPAANLLLFEETPAGRQGLAYGMKQAAIPMAAFLSGVAVPAVALTVGWRWAMAGASLLALAGLALVVRASGVRSRPGSARGWPPPLALRSLLPLAVSGGMGSMVAVSLATFLVAFAVHSGFAEGAAGLLLAVGSVINFGMRLTAGWLVDHRWGTSSSLLAGLLMAGAVGLVVLALGGSDWAILVGTLVAFGGAWGWPGVMNLAIIQRSPHAPASATGILQSGTLLGSALGPPAFAYLVAHGSYGLAWGVMAAVALGAGLLVSRSARAQLA
jgi:MFS family permease